MNPKPALTLKPGTGRGTLSRTVVLETSARLFNQLGFDRTSMNDIARELGVTKPSLYHYFPGKDDILEACILESADTFQGEVEAALQAPAAAVEKLRTFMRHYVMGMRNEMFRAMVLADQRALTETGRALVKKCKRRLNRLVEDLIRKAVKEGDVRVANPRLASFAVFGMYNWMAVWRSDWPERSGEIEDMFDEMSINALSVPEASSRTRKPK